MIVPFRVTDKSMLLHLNRQGNRSEYLRGLIRADMDIVKVEFNAENLLEAIVERRLRELVEQGQIVFASNGSACPWRRQDSPVKAARLVKSILEV